MSGNYLAEINSEILQESYLDTSKPRLLIVTLVADPNPQISVPVLNRPYEIPNNLDWRKVCINGMSIDRGYTEAVLMALREETTYVMFIEDDTFPPLDAISRLIQQDMPIIGGWYPRRDDKARTGTPNIIVNGIRQPLDTTDGKLYSVETLPMGCTLIKTDVFKTIPWPWFLTARRRTGFTFEMTQDVFFSQKAREAGYTLWCDTSILCQHIDRVTGQIFE